MDALLVHILFWLARYRRLKLGIGEGLYEESGGGESITAKTSIREKKSITARPTLKSPPGGTRSGRMMKIGMYDVPAIKIPP